MKVSFLILYTIFLVNYPLISAISLTEKHRMLCKEALEKAPEYPENTFSGKGVVIAAGGIDYLINAWVSVCMLRKSGCQLPVEIWYLGDKEYIPPLMEELEQMGAICKDIKLYFDYPIKGWEIKVHAILTSSFQEILFLDADCLVVRNPEYLFEEAKFLETGACFWPDQQLITKTNLILDVLDIPLKDYLAQESGQMVIDKEKSWLPLQLCLHMNRNSRFYYSHIHGDKDTFHLSWKALGAKYCIVPYMPYEVCKSDRFSYNQFAYAISCYLHRDFQGDPLFLHASGFKWNLRKNDQLFFNYYSRTDTLLTEINPDLSSEKKVYSFREIFPTLAPSTSVSFMAARVAQSRKVL